MPKCSECGFLVVWLPTDDEFVEATETFRNFGYFSSKDQKGCSYHAKCFVRAQDLAREEHQWLTEKDPLNIANLKVIEADRDCQSFTPWLQGFNPKEHAERQFHEMLRNEQRQREERSLQFHETLRNEQRHHEKWSLGIALGAVIISAVGIIVGSFINLNAVRMQTETARESIQIETAATRDSTRQQMEATDRQTDRLVNAQIEAAQMQIDAQKALTPAAPKKGNKKLAGLQSQMLNQ